METTIKRAGKFARLVGARSGLDLARRPFHLSDPSLVDPADLETVAAHLMLSAGTNSLVFAQIGAFDGASNDPLQALVTKHGWTGALVEPQPGPFERLQATYQDVRGLSLVNAAVSKEAGEVTFFTVPPGPGIPPWAQQIASIDEASIRRQTWRTPAVRDAITPIRVKAVTLDDVFNLVGGRVDVLQIDCEGYDREVIRMVDLKSPDAPAIVRFEHQHLVRRDYVDVCRDLADAGFGIRQGVEDTLAYRPR